MAPAAAMARPERLVGAEAYKLIIQQARGKFCHKVVSATELLHTPIGNEIKRSPQFAFGNSRGQHQLGKFRRARYQRHAEMGLIGKGIIGADMRHHATASENRAHGGEGAVELGQMLKHVDREHDVELAMYLRVNSSAPMP